MQIYVKTLPKGEPVQLTRDLYQKEQPVFSPDGSRIIYTAVMPGIQMGLVAGACTRRRSATVSSRMRPALSGSTISASCIPRSWAAASTWAS